MKTWIRFSIIFTIFVSFLACTNNQEQVESRLSNTGSRGLASIGSKRSVKVEQKGLLISHRSLLNISEKDRVTYYRIFVNFLEMREKAASQFRKKTASHNLIKDIFVPTLDADYCTTALWTVEFGANVRCNSANSKVPPQQTPGWSDYGIVGLDYSHCSGQNYVCPPLGLDSNNKLLCSNPSTRRISQSQSCLNKFGAGGITRMVRVLDRCEKESKESVSGLSCSGLKSSWERTQKMVSDNCQASNFKGTPKMNRFMVGKCNGLKKAVNRIATAIKQVNNPSASAGPSQNATSCKNLSNQVESSANPSLGRNSSESWNYLLDFAKNVCGHGKSNESRRSMASKLGDCSVNIEGGLSGEVKDTLVTKDLYDLARAGKKQQFNREFAKNFGLSMRGYRDVLCGNKKASDFRAKVSKDLDKITEDNRAGLVNDFAYHHMKNMSNGSYPFTESQHTVLRDFFKKNNVMINNEHKDKADQERTRGKLKADPSIKATVKNEFFKVAKSYKSIKKIKEQFKLWLKSKKIADYDHKLYRYALREVMIDELIPAKQEARMAAGKKFLQKCSNLAVDFNNPRKADGSADPYKPRTNQCSYRKIDSDVYEFFRDKHDSGEGYSDVMIEKVGGKGPCYVPEDGIQHDTGGEKNVFYGNFVNPEDSTDSAGGGDGKLFLNDNTFGKGKNYVLHYYFCAEGPAELDESLKGGAVPQSAF